jgi:hypothetical protein
VPRSVKTDKKADYRKFLEDMEPAALKVLKQALKDESVPIKERKEIAMDVLTRLHGKVIQNTEVEDAKKRVEGMSNDELREFIMELAAETGIKAVQQADKQVIN